MTKKDYIKLAKVISENTIIADKGLPSETRSLNYYPFIFGLMQIFESDNPLFDAKKFHKAIN